jgi:hypothetical protein
MAFPLVHRLVVGALSWRVATYNAASLVQAGRYDDFVFCKFDIVAVLGPPLQSDLRPNLSG